MGISIGLIAAKASANLSYINVKVLPARPFIMYISWATY